jgi:hypothetical protein
VWQALLVRMRERFCSEKGAHMLIACQQGAHRAPIVAALFMCYIMELHCWF